MRFTDRVALITAAASGIGKATAEIVGARRGGWQHDHPGAGGDG